MIHAIGAAFACEGGEGSNIALQALLIDVKIVLRLPKEGQPDGLPQVRARTTKPGSQRR